MTNRKTTKRALLSSVLALVLCFAMLLGTTFAWFTDNATTKVNKIQSGKLDVQLLDKEGNSLEGKTLSFQKAEGHENDELLWEPGCTYNLETVTIKNAGNLALKFKIEVTGLGDEKSAKLNEAIEWTINTTDAEKVTGSDTEYYLIPDQEAKLTISGHMKEEAGNEYQNLTIDGAAITVLATQYTYEYDSYNNTYDAGAEYGKSTDNAADKWDGKTENVPAEENGVITISNAAQFAGLMQNYSISYRGKTIVLDANIDFGGATISGFSVGGSGQFDAIFDGNGYTISNFKIESNTEYMTGLFGNIGVHKGATIKNLTVKDATVIGKTQVGVIAGAINDGAIVENCKVENCTVIGTKKVGGVVGYTLSSSVTGCSATNVDVYCADTNKTESGEIVGYVNTGSTVTNNTPTNVNVYRGVTFVSNQAELAAAGAKGGNIILSNDISISGNWTPIKVTPSSQNQQIAYSISIDGNGHTITGLNHSLIGEMAARNITVKNLTIKDSDISGVGDSNDTNCGAFVSYLDGFNFSLTLDNCHTKNVNITATQSSDNTNGTGIAAGGLVGYNGANNATIAISNCSVTGGSVTNSYGNAAGIIGMWQLGGNVAISNCSVSNVTLTGEKTEKVGQIVGTVNGSGTLTISGCTYSGNAYGRVVGDASVN